MSNQLQYYRDSVIAPFVQAVIEDTNQRLAGNFLIRLEGEQSDQLERAFQTPLSCPLGQRLDAIARAAASQATDQERDEVQGAIQYITELLFSLPGEVELTTSPDFWQTPVGMMVNRAWLWLDQDEMISQSEAAEMLGYATTQAVADLISRGALRVIYDDSEPNPQRRRRVSRKQVEGLRG